MLLIVGLFISNFIFTILKTSIKRKRPYADKEVQNILEIDIQNRDIGHGSKEYESFPSGHALWTTLCVSLIYFQYGVYSFIFLGWLIPVILFLRLYLGVHYPSDALAGATLGIIDAKISVFITDLFFNKIYNYYDNVFFIIGYWCFMLLFIFLGMKSWIKRVRV